MVFTETKVRVSGGNGFDPQDSAFEQGSVFDNLDALRLPLDDQETGGVREVLTTVPVRKPRKSEFIRAHPDPAMSLAAAIYEDKGEQLSGEVYFVMPQMRAELAGLARAVTLVTSVTRQGVTFLWPVPLPSLNARRNEWAESARIAAELAKTKWLRIVPDMALGRYRPYVAEGASPSRSGAAKPSTNC